jgi:methionine-rich copper-binding protein CopC
VNVKGLIAAMLLFTAVGVGPAAAHAALVSSDPPSGAILTEPPTQVTLTFNETLLETMVAVSVRDEQDTVLLSSVAEAAGATVLFGWPSDANAGTYFLAYRVVSADGHPVTGEIEVTIDPSASTEAIAASLEPADQSAGLPNWVLVVAIGLLIGVAVGLITMALRRKRV